MNSNAMEGPTLMKNTKVWISVAAVSLLSFSSCRFGNNVVAGPAIVDPNATGSCTAPQDALVAYEGAYPNTPFKFEFCFIRGKATDPSHADLICSPGSLSNIPSGFTTVFSDPINFGRFCGSAGLVWGVQNPANTAQFMTVNFDSTTAGISYTGSGSTSPFWSSAPTPDTTCTVNYAAFLSGTANPQNKSLGLIYEGFNNYSAPCNNGTLQAIASCMKDASTCGQGSTDANQAMQTTWTGKFSPWINGAGMTTDDIPYLWATGYRVSFK